MQAFVRGQQTHTYLQGEMDLLLRGPSSLALQDTGWSVRLAISGGGMSTVFNSSVESCPLMGKQLGQWMQSF